MGEYDWDEKIDYLRKTRNLYYNDDYLEFLIQSVWKISDPVRIVDYGCGYGFLGLKLLPLLPEGSTYTGLDQGEKLVRRAEEIFSGLPYHTQFIRCDVNEFRTEQKYDIALCRALLLHMPDPILTLSSMLESVKDQGRIICFEPHWIANMANFHLSGAEQSKIAPLGILQQLNELDTMTGGKDGNIGIKIPAYLSQLGVKNIECRVSDKVVFLDPNSEEEHRKNLFHSLLEDGVGADPGEPEPFIEGFVRRGMGLQEAEQQHQAEMAMFKLFSMDSLFSGSANMKITSGIVSKKGRME